MSAGVHAAAPSEALTAGGLAVLSLGALDFGLEQSILVPALPSLAGHYHASLIAVAWLATGFLLAASVAVPLFGRLGDMFGKRRLILVSLGCFCAGSLLSALAHSIAPAIAGRAIQGCGTAVAPLTVSLVRDTLPPQLLTRAIGVVVGAANVGGAIGFLVSGLLVDWFSPAAIFWFLFGFGALLAAGVYGLVAESPLRKRVRPDVAGAALLGVGLVALLLAISKGEAWHWSSAAVIGLFAAAAVVLCAFAVVERRLSEPLIDLRLVGTRPFLNANLCAFTFGFAFFIATYLLPQIAATPDASGYGLGLSTTQIGLLLIPTSIVGMAAGWAAGRTVDRVGPRALVVLGCVTGLAAYVLLALTHDTVAALAIGSALIGVGWGVTPTSWYPVTLRSAATDESGVAVAIPLVFRNIGVSIGVTAAFVVLSGDGFTGPFRADAGFTHGFVLGAAATGLALVAAVFLPGVRSKRALRS